MKIRKTVKGADSYGNFWEDDNAVLDIDAEQAAHLLAVPDGGFSIVEDHEEFHDDTNQGLPDGPDTEGGRRRRQGSGHGPASRPRHRRRGLARRHSWRDPDPGPGPAAGPGAELRERPPAPRRR